MVEQHRSLVRKLEECRSRYTDLVAAAGRQGLTEMQLMSAAVDACGPADVAAPVALDAAAAQLKLLVDYVVDAPGSDAVQLLPAVWTEAEVTKLFKGEYPWRRGGRSGAVAAVLAERFSDVCAEMARTIEELVLQRFERERTQQYFLYVKN
ncbi:hypothetical protein OEZ86_010149 [Tetradesmus obliquus]|nr:hypothetical protein OEZ86_010149 [Tetradesmus obliquus]